MAQIAIAWALSKEGASHALVYSSQLFYSMDDLGVTAPIVGTTSLKNLEDILG